MRELGLDELPRYSPWPARLLGLEPWSAPTRDTAKVQQEYDGDKYARCLRFFEQAASTGRGPTVDEVRLEETEADPQAETCVSVDGRLYVMPMADALARYEQALCDAVGKELDRCAAVVELGSGYGYNLWLLRRRYAGKTMAGGDYSANAVDLGNRLFEDDDSVTFHRFDFYDERTYAFIDQAAGPVVVFTSYGVEQLPSAQAFCGALRKHCANVASIVQLEPLHGLYDDSLLGLMRRRYTELNDYNRDLLGILTSTPGIRVVDVRPDVLGLNPSTRCPSCAGNSYSDLQKEREQLATVELIPPHGGTLKELLVPAARAGELKQEAIHLPSWDLTPRQVCDVELLLNGGFSPLTGFLGRADYESVCKDMRLADGTLWPMPIMLDVTEEFASSLSGGTRVALRHPEGIVLAVLTVGDVWTPDRSAEAQQVFGTTDEFHPGVFSLVQQTNPVYLGGALEGLELPPHHTFGAWRKTPSELRAEISRSGRTRVVAFQTRNPMHRVHVELTLRAARQVEADLLIHPVVGQTKPGDIDEFVRVRCYEAVLPRYPGDSTMLSLLPLAMRMGGPREAVWHAIIRKNYGCTHLIVGRDHAGPSQDHDDKPFYGPYEAQELLQQHEVDAGIQVVAFPEMVYLAGTGEYVPRPEVPEGAKVLTVSGTELRNLLAAGAEVPGWFSYPEVLHELQRSYPQKSRQGFTVFFTGLPSSGKSTLANTLLAKLTEVGTRAVTLLDGDIVRKHLSSELGFSREHRDINIRRIGFVASEITKNGGAAICAPIGPYAVTRREVREMVGQYGGFVEVYVSTPLEVCEARDRKGLYAKARAGVLKGFTGIDDPYEAPEHAEVTIDTTSVSPEEGAGQVLEFLASQGYLVPGGGSP